MSSPSLFIPLLLCSHPSRTRTQDRSPIDAHRHPKRRRFSPSPGPAPIDALADELLFLVLDRVAAVDPRALKSFALASRACHAAESRHRRLLRPLLLEWTKALAAASSMALLL